MLTMAAMLASRTVLGSNDVLLWWGKQFMYRNGALSKSCESFDCFQSRTFIVFRHWLCSFDCWKQRRPDGSWAELKSAWSLVNGRVSLCLAEEHVCNMPTLIPLMCCFLPCWYIHCESKKHATILLSVTSPNVDWFSKFFHWQTQW